MKPLRYPLLYGLFLFVCSQTVTAETLQLGMSAPLTGPAADIGQQYAKGAQLAFHRFNQQGGVAGRQIELLLRDDGYEPLQTVEHTRFFLQQAKVFALFGYVGTPTSAAVLSLLRKYRRPFVMPFTGAELLRQPADDFIFHFRAGYREEARAQIHLLVDQLGLRKVALLIQADEFGSSVANALLAELKHRHIKPLTIARFQRNSSELAQAVQQLAIHNPELVLTVGTYEPLTYAIRQGQQQNFNPVYSVVSFTGVSQLHRQLPANAQVYASMVVPAAISQHPLAIACRQAAEEHKSNCDNEILLEGFAAASLFSKALEACQTQLTASCVLSRLPDQSLHGLPLRYQHQRHQASANVFLYRLTATGTLQPMSSG